MISDLRHSDGNVEMKWSIVLLGRYACKPALSFLVNFHNTVNENGKFSAHIFFLPRLRKRKNRWRKKRRESYTDSP